MIEYQGVRVLLLGGAGFIGRWVGHRLHASGADLHMFVLEAQPARALMERLGVNANLSECDLADSAEITARIRSLQPDVVFNLAGYGVNRAERDATIAERINAELVATVCAAMLDVAVRRWTGQRFMHVGSALEYGTVPGDLAEDTEEQPTTLYGQTKLRGTRAVSSFGHKRGLRGVTARLFTVYGPGERPERLLPTLISAASGSEPIALTAGMQQRDFTYVEDVAEGLLRLGISQAEPGAIVNLASGQLRAVREFVETAADILGIARERLLFGALPTREEEMSHSPVSNARLRSLTGWTPSADIADGMRRTISRGAM